MKLLDVYTENIANWISGGNLINRDKISSIGIKPAFDRVLTKQYIRKVWIITSLPVYYQNIISQMIRNEMYLKCPDCKTIINTYNTPVNVNTTGDAFKRQMHHADNQFNEYADVFEQLQTDEQLTGKVIKLPNGRKIHIRREELERIREKRDSYQYVYISKQQGSAFFNTYFFIEALCPTKSDMIKYKRNFTEMLKQNDIYFKEVKGNVGSFLKNFGVASYIHEDVKKFDTMLFSDENLTSCTNYKTRGLVGGTGILFGMDFKTKLPFILNLFASSSGQVCLITGKTGSGKTYAAFQIALSLTADNVHCSVIDIKGDEWDRLSPYVKLVEINMDDTNPRFVNTLRLDDIECDESNSDAFYKMALRGTVQLLALMVNLQPNEGNPADLDTILEQAVTKLFTQRGVKPDDPLTFKKTHDMKYEEVLPILVDLAQSTSFSPDEIRLAGIARTRCSRYLSMEGRYADAFKNEITISEVIDTPLVIYSFNKNKEGIMDSLDTLRVFMVQFLDTKKQSIRKAQGLHTAAFYEELQRCDQFGKLVTYIAHSVTGSRSSNVIVFLLCNSLASFDTFDMAPIKSNITTKISGKLSPGDIEKLCVEYDAEDMRKDLEKIKDGDKYEHCLAIKYDTGADTNEIMYKVVLPDDMVEQFRTRDLKD